MHCKSIDLLVLFQANVVKLCLEANSMLDPDQDQGQLLDSVRIKLSFDEPMVITGLRIMSQEASLHLGWIKQINKVHYQLPASLGGGGELTVDTTGK